MPPPQPRLKLYYDILSPFAYIAFHVVTTAPLFKNCEVTVVPVLLGGIMKACGNTGPLSIKNKDKWTNAERLRSAALFGVPMNDGTPPQFPVSTVTIQRHLCALAILSPAQLVPVSSALYRHYFVSHKPIKDDADFMPVLERLLGPKLAQEVHEAASTIGKKRLEANTTEAIADGAFGLPWFVAEGGPQGQKECFWGVDHLGQVVDALGLERPESSWRSLL